MTGMLREFSMMIMLIFDYVPPNTLLDTYLISLEAVMSPVFSLIWKGVLEVLITMLYFIAAAAPVSRSVAIT